jgi:hypothetical protein
MVNVLMKTTAIAALLSGAFAAPKLIARTVGVQTPTDGFPNPSTQQLASIEQVAQGTLPNGAAPPPGAINADSIINFQLIQFNENFEVAFFTSLLNNVTAQCEGYGMGHGMKYSYIVDALKAIVAVSIPTLESCNQ